jgi:two-component system, sensor histidine kinase YesM
MIRINESTNRLMKRFFSLKIRTKFLFSFIFVILIITGTVGGVTYFTSSLVLENNTEDLSVQLVNQIAVNIEYKAKDLNELTYSIIQSENLKAALPGRGEARSEAGLAILRRKIRTLIYGLVLSNNHINFVCIQTKDGSYFWWDKNNMPATMTSIDEITVKGIIDKVSGRLGESYNGMLWTASDRNDNEVIFARNMIDEKNVSNNLGIIVFGVNGSYLRMLESGRSVVKEENIMILDHENNPLIRSSILDDRQFEEFSQRKDIIDAPISSMHARYGKKDYILTRYETGMLKWKIFCFIPTEKLMRNADLLKTMILLVSLSAIGAAVIIAFILAYNMTKNISSLEKNMRLVEEGNLRVRVKPASYDEIGLLGLRFNYMVNRINDLINTVYEERLAKQQAEFEVLQAQISPHFLYNTLGSIKWLAHMKEQGQIEQMVTALIELLKAAVKKKGRYQTVNEEISYIKNYLMLQKFRFEDRFRVEFQVETAVENCYVLHFMLQPLVENALYHGIRMTDSSGMLWIRIYRSGEVLKLEVEDNGVGMTEETIEKILSNEQKNIYPGMNSIGVRNVNERIKLYFGEEYGLKYTSMEGSGTKVEIALPFIADMSEVKKHD